MARFRLSALAEEDLAVILETSLERWGKDGRSRYAALLAEAMRAIAADPEGATTRDRGALLRGVRSFHVRHSPDDHRVKEPVHVLYYRLHHAGLIEILRVLHERMDPSRHVVAVKRARSAPRR